MVVLNLSVGKVLRSMERCGVDFSLVSSIESTEYYKPHKRLPFFLRRSTLRVCKKTVRAVKRHPDKLGALLWIQTGRKIPVERLSRFIEKNRRYIYGIKIHPYRSEVAPDDPRMEPVYELAKRFPAFLENEVPKNPLKSEYFVPSVVNAQLQEGSATIAVLDTPDAWHGVTYPEDLPGVKQALKALTDAGTYPEGFWK